MSDASLVDGAPLPAGPTAFARLLGVAPLVIFVALLVYLGIRAPNLLEPATLGLILKQAVPTIIVCLGLATVIMAGGDDVVSGGIDLSVPATAVLSAAIVAQQLSVQDAPLAQALALALGAALTMGVLNALLVVRVGMTPLLATLASSVAAVGLTKVVTSSRRINVDDPFIVYIRDANVAGIPASVLITSALVLVFWFGLHRTRAGLNLQAVGGNREAAQMSGLSTQRFVAASFVIAGFAGGLAALAVLARGSGSTPGSEENLLLEMVLATFLGAAFSPRRVVTLWGAVLGAVLVSILSVGFKSIGVNVFWTDTIKGGLILLVVASAAQAGRASLAGRANR